MAINRVSDGRLDITLSGKLDTDGMRVALEEFMAKSEGMEHGRMYYRIENFEWSTFGAMMVELSHLPKVFRLIGRFDRCAVVVGEGWIRKVSEFEGALIPGLEVKGFELGQEVAAEAWLTA